MRRIVIEIMDHVSDEEVQDFVDDINATFQPHKDAYVENKD